VQLENHAELVTMDALQAEASMVKIASDIWVRADVYFACGGNSRLHADAPRVCSNPAQTDVCCMYVCAAVSYPSCYPCKTSQVSSLFVEIPYSSRASGEQARYEKMEINLGVLRDAGAYSKHPTNCPLYLNDPRIDHGDTVSIVSFTTSGYL